METISLREPAPYEPVDPEKVSPDPGVMGQMYLKLRELPQYADGMVLACASIKDPELSYDDIVKRYEIESQVPEFSDIDFFHKYFEVSPPDNTSHAAKPGQTLDDYTLDIREKFIFPNTEQGQFDIWLPYNRSVAGIGRFGKHSFLWDGYQIAKGYAADGRWDLVLDIIDNAEYQINRFGYPLNGSADFYATRSQPDYFAHEVRMLADHLGPEVLVRYLPALQKDHDKYWMDGMDRLANKPLGELHTHRSLVRMPDGSFLNRYWDDADRPRLESYKEDVEVGEIAAKGLVGIARDRKLSKVYRDLRAGATSGWDYSSRWFKDGSNLHTINTTDIAPIDLNSLMVYHEETLALACEVAAETPGYDRDEYMELAAKYQYMADQRMATMNKYNWDPVDKIYRDYNFVDGHQTGILSAAMAYPLYVGAANAEQSFGVMDAIDRELFYPGGIIATNTENSKEQWEGGKRGGKRSKNVWAPPNWAAVRGMGRSAHILSTPGMVNGISPSQAEDLKRGAERYRRAYMGGIRTAFNARRVVPEKHRGDRPDIPANGGEYELVSVLAMSGETYRAMDKVNPWDRADHLPRYLTNASINLARFASI